MKVDSAEIWQRIVQVLGTENAPEIARMFGITKQSVYEWQRGNMPRLNTLIEIAELGGVSLHWLITGRGMKEFMYKDEVESAKAIFVRFNDADRLLVERLSKEEGRTLHDQIDRLIAEALVARGLVPSRYEMLAPILQLLDELPLSKRREIAKSLQDLYKGINKVDSPKARR